jgi:hypothetical protein
MNVRVDEITSISSRPRISCTRYGRSPSSSPRLEGKTTAGSRGLSDLLVARASHLLKLL